MYEIVIAPIIAPIASEIFTTGTSSLVYMRYKNVNNKLFRTLLIPGEIGAAIILPITNPKIICQ